MCLFPAAAALLTNKTMFEKGNKKTTMGSGETKHPALSSPLLTTATAIIRTTTKGILGYQVTFVSPFAV